MSRITVHPSARRSGRELRDAGIEQVASHHERDYLRIRQAIRTVAARGLQFTSDDVWPFLGEGVTRNAIGAAFNHAAKDGEIVEVGITKVVRPSGHARKITLWVRRGH